MRMLALASLLIPTAIAPADVRPMVIVSPDAIVQVICFGKDDVVSGTAFRVGPTFGLSVNHVTSAGQCFIAGKAAAIAYKSPDADFSELLIGEGPYLPIDCGGFVKGRKYLALGFARGEADVEVELTATGDAENGEAILSGLLSVIPGQSGGPIISEDTGKVVGTVNAENFEEGLSWSVPLSSTPVCGAKA